MTHFRLRPGSKSATRKLKHPFRDSATFSTVIQKILAKNPLGCTSYYSLKRNFPPVIPVRERYTAKFVYHNRSGKQVGTSSGSVRFPRRLRNRHRIHDYEHGQHRLPPREGEALRESDLFSVTLKCHDPSGELYFLSLARDRITISSYTDDAILKRVEAWTDSVPELQ